MLEENCGNAGQINKRTQCRELAVTTHLTVSKVPTTLLMFHVWHDEQKRYKITKLAWPVKINCCRDCREFAKLAVHQSRVNTNSVTKQQIIFQFSSQLQWRANQSPVQADCFTVSNSVVSLPPRHHPS